MAFLNFRYWMEGEPNDQSGSEDCVEIIDSVDPMGNWNDYSCNTEKYFVCELP